jgi:hypothetical protein
MSAMARRELLDLTRLALLQLRVRIGRPLRAGLMALLATLDRWAAERAIDRPWTAEASARLDRRLSERERER